jgi:acetyltransferase-like isoleucine patch superfamily enzyme
MLIEELRSMMKKRKYRGYSYGYVIKSFLHIFLYDCVRFIPSPLGELLRYLELKIFCKKIESVWIRAGTAFFFPENISIGRGVSINDNVFINGAGGFEIMDGSGIAYGTAVISEDHEIGDPRIPIREQPKIPAKVTIEKQVWVAANCTILKGVTIGEGSVVAAGSVVTRSVPPYSIVGGNPARVMRTRKIPTEEERDQGSGIRGQGSTPDP